MCRFTDIYWTCGPHLWQRFLQPCPNVLPGHHFCDSVHRDHPRQRLGNCPNCPPMIRAMPESPYSNGCSPSQQGQRQAPQVHHNQDQVPCQAGASRQAAAPLLQSPAQWQAQDDQMQALVARQADLSLDAQVQSQAELEREAEAIAQLAARRLRDLQGRSGLQTETEAEAGERVEAARTLLFMQRGGGKGT